MGRLLRAAEFAAAAGLAMGKAKVAGLRSKLNDGRIEVMVEPAAPVGRRDVDKVGPVGNVKKIQRIIPERLAGGFVAGRHLVKRQVGGTCPEGPAAPALQPINAEIPQVIACFFNM